ncbi:MAG: sulfatase [Chitinophagaceae bacterium]
MTITRWPVLILSGIILTAIACATLGKSGTVKSNSISKPNVVIILADQWRGQAMGILGKEKVQTPFLDSFSKHSLVLTQMVSNYPVCSPARAMLLTGKYPFNNHVYSNVNSASAPFGIELPDASVCWSDILKANNYSNGYIGKWHLDSPHEPFIPTSNNKGKVAWNEWTPPNRRHGFDYWYSYGTYDEHDRPMYWDTDAPRDSFHYVNEWGPEHEADKALAFFRNDKKVRDESKPFSLVVSMNPPHSDYKTVPKKYYNRYNNVPLQSLITDADIPAAGTAMGDFYRENIKYYYANITGVDEQIGRIINGLKNSGKLDNTIVIITADHGNCLGKHDEISKNNMYEESLIIPFIIYWKGKIMPGIDNKFLGSIPDIYPTLLEMTGLKKEIPADIDGKSYAPYFLNRTGSTPTEQFILGNIVSSKVDGNTGFRGIRTERYTLAYQLEGKKMAGFLFDLKNDPFEMHNLFDKDGTRVITMKKNLVKWLKKTNDPFILE